MLLCTVPVLKKKCIFFYYVVVIFKEGMSCIIQIMLNLLVYNLELMKVSGTPFVAVKGLKFESIIGKIRNHTHRATTLTTQHSPITNLLAKS